MKTLTLVLLFSVIASVCFSQSGNPKADKLEYFYRMEKYRKMKSTGIGLTLVGGGLAIAGIITSANSSIDYIDDGNGNTTTQIHGHPIAGVLMIVGGHAALGVGIPLWIMGNAKEKRYQKKLEQVSLNFTNSPNQRGLKLTFRF